MQETLVAHVVQELLCPSGASLSAIVHFFKFIFLM